MSLTALSNQHLDDTLDPELLRIIRCPHDQSALLISDPKFLRCKSGHSFPIVQGVPVLLRPDQQFTLWVSKASWDEANKWTRGLTDGDHWFVSTLGLSNAERENLNQRIKTHQESQVDPVISFMLLATSGYLYKDLVGKLESIPIPNLEMKPGTGRLLDIGCNWGRWTMSAAKLGYSVVGIDPSLGGVLAAKRLSQHLGLKASFVCGDGRFLPFATQTFSKVFSYSVIQHMSEADALLCLREVKRVLDPDGESLIQMPNALGIRSFYHLARRRFQKPKEFDVRYWTPIKLSNTFRAVIGESKLSVDGFLGLGIQPSDFHILSWKSKVVILVSQTLKTITKFFPPLKYVADSLYVRSKAK